jgi:homocysteine S-methyltransferase
MDLLTTLASGPILADGAMGSYIFEQTGRLSEANHVYEALNIDNPELVRQIHLAYLSAGARCLTTNTFAANSTHLVPVGEGARLAEINEAGVRLARESITAYQRQTNAELPCFVLGSIGPTHENDESPEQAKRVYSEQLGPLLEAGVDAIVLETFTFLPHLRAVLELIGETADPPPVFAQMSLRQKESEEAWDPAPVTFVETAADLGAAVVGVNCCAPWEALAFVDAVEKISVVQERHIHLSAMPNAGGIQRIGHRYMTRVNPEYMGKLTRTLADRGVRLIGGCCEVHPRHVREMRNYLTSRQAGGKTAAAIATDGPAPVGDDTKKDNGPFSRKIKEGNFAVSVEVVPSRGTAPQVLARKIEFVRHLAASGVVDALDVTDGSRGIALMPPGDFINVLRNGLGWTTATGDGVEFIAHFTTRDLNVLGLQSRLIGYWGNRIHNVLFVTGDPPKMSPTYPRSTAVFDLDSVDMINLAQGFLNRGQDFGGQPLGRHADPRTHFTIGSGLEPEAVDCAHELDKLRRKIDGGADYIMTQPAFRYQPLDRLEPFRARVPILVGVMILTGLEHARRVAQIPGVSIPSECLDRLGAHADPADQAKVARDIAIEQVRWVKREGWAGLYLMSPGSMQLTLDVLQAGN